jgi:CRP/FNR family transcriptional regulator, cyclic AMP receptor protein
MTESGVQDEYLALLLRSGDSEPFTAGAKIFDEGDAADTVYLVKDGEVELTTGANHVLEIVGPGGIFGEMAVIERDTRSATAIARTDCELVTIDRRRFWFLVQETPYFAEIVMRVMADRLRRETSRS